MSAPQHPDTPAGSAALPRMSAILRKFASGVRQFWEGYWASPHGC